MSPTQPDETTAQLATALGLGVEVIEGRRRLLGFDEAAAARLRAMAPAAIAGGPAFIDLLYRRLLACPATASWLRGDDQIARLKRAQLAHHERLFAGDVDWATVLDCLRIGSVHHRVRLSPQWYVATFAHWVADHVELAFAADLTRGCSRGEPWMLMEQSTSAVNWGLVNRPKVPGEMWRNTLAQVARGADSVSYFQWRASAGGAEKFHSAMVPHAGRDSRVFREVVAQGRRLELLAELAGSRSRNRVAVLFDYPSWWAVEQDSHPRQDYSYRTVMMAWYEPLWRANCGVDVVGTDADLAPYDVIVVPGLYLTTDATAAAVAAAAERGATVLVTWFSGIVDEHDRVRLGGYPGAFRDLVGVRVEEFVNFFGYAFPAPAAGSRSSTAGRAARPGRSTRGRRSRSSPRPRRRPPGCRSSSRSRSRIRPTAGFRGPRRAAPAPPSTSRSPTPRRP